MIADRIERPYQPIACASYERYEFAILRRHLIRLAWNDGRQVTVENVLPVDLMTRDGQEFLVAIRPDGARLTLRLDAIQSAEFPDP